VSLRAVSRLVVQSLTGAALALSFYRSARLAWADHLSRSAQLADRAHATALAPTWASLYDRVAERRVDLGEDPLPQLRRGVELDPEDSGRIARLAQYAELSGDLGLAEQSLLESAARSRLYQPRYLLAQFYFRRGDADAFRKWARSALDVAPDDVQPLLDLCWRMQPEVMAGRPQILRQWLKFLLLRHDQDAAYELAKKLGATALNADGKILIEYIESALADRQTGRALEIWNALCEKRLVPYERASYGHLTNSQFERQPMGKGFDWRLESTPGVEVTQTSNGLRLAFSGAQPETCVLVWQYAPIRPGERYRATSRALPQGLAWEVDSLGRVRLTYRRPIGKQRFEGVATVTDVKLEPLT
jgi:hypothetical protein